MCHSQLLNYCCVSVRKILRAACQLNRPVTVLTMENSYTSRTKSSKLLQQSSLNYLYFAVLARTPRDAMSMNSPSVDSFHLHPIRAKLLQHFTSCMSNSPYLEVRGTHAGLDAFSISAPHDPSFTLFHCAPRSKERYVLILSQLETSYEV